MAIANKRLQTFPILHVPRDGSTRSIIGGTGTVTFDPGYGIQSSDTGVPSGWQLTAPSGRQASGALHTAAVAFPFEGRVGGFQLWRRAGGNVPDPLNLGVIIDGRVYQVLDARLRWMDDTITTTHGLTARVIVDDDLPPTPDGRPHQMEIHLWGNPQAGAATRNAYVLGALVDKVTGGYAEMPRYGAIIDSVTVPTTASVPALVGSGRNADSAARAVSQIHYSNPLAVAVPVSVTFQGPSAGAAMQFWTPETSDGKVPAGGTSVLRFQRPTVLPTGGTRFRHSATMPTTPLSANISSTATGNATLTGGAAALGVAIGTALTVRIGSETIAGTFTDANTLNMTGRGQSGTTATTHTSGATVTLLTPGITCSIIGEA